MLVYRKLFLVVLIGLALSCTFNPKMDPEYWPCKSDGTCPVDVCECFDGRVCIPEGDETNPALCEWCEDGYDNCDTLPANGCESRLDNPKSCGSCTNICNDGQLCEIGACVDSCREGFSQCGMTCLDTQADPENCGDCDQACKSSQVCDGGECKGECSGDLKPCDGSCTDKTSDPENCGRCGRLCVLPNARPKCELSVCLVDECIHPFGDCDRQVDGCKTLLKTNAEHCGECGNDCGQNAVCAESQCGCAEFFGNCDEDWSTGCEIRVKTDPMNCGECGNVCDQPPNDYCEENLLMVHPRLGECAEYLCGYEPVPTECMFGCESGECLGDPCKDVRCDEGEICVNGICACGGTGPDCHSEQACCGTECVYTYIDPVHCGFCFFGCGDAAHCTNSLCYCDELWGDCNGSWSDGCEVDVTTPQNCGACGNSCSTGELCCGGICMDLLQDDLNCGTCGNDCPAGQICCGGGCVDPLYSFEHCGRCWNTCVADRACDLGSCGSVGVDCAGGNFCDPFLGQRCCYSSVGGMGCNTTNDCTDHMFDCDGPEDCDAGFVCCAVMAAAQTTACIPAIDCATTFVCNSDLQCQESNPDAGFCCPENIMGVDIFVCMQQCG